MSELNQPSEQDRQQYGKRKAKYFLLAIGALALSLLFSHIANGFPVGSSARSVFLGLGALSLLLTFYCFFADRWNKFESAPTKNWAEIFLALNRIADSFCSLMISTARFFSAGAEYFLKKKSRIEKNQLLILERMQEMKDENRGANYRIETGITSLRSDVRDNTAILNAIREENDAALARHQERVEQLKADIADLKARVESLQASDDHSLAEEIAQLRSKLEENRTDLSNEQAHIEQLEEKKESLEKVDVSKLSFESLLTVPAAKKKSEELEKMAREIAEASKGKSKKYLYELAKFYRAMVDCGYLWENESAFILLFYNDYGRSRDVTWDSFRRSFNYAVTRLSSLEYTNYKDEIREIVLG